MSVPSITGSGTLYEVELDLHELLSEGLYKLSVSEGPCIVGTGDTRFPCRQASWSANLDSFEAFIVFDEHVIARDHVR